MFRTISRIQRFYDTDSLYEIMDLFTNKKVWIFYKLGVLCMYVRAL